MFDFTGSIRPLWSYSRKLWFWEVKKRCFLWKNAYCEVQKRVFEVWKLRFGVRNRQEMQKKCEKTSVSGDSQEILVDLEMWQKMLKWPFLVVLSINRWKGHVCKFCWNDLTMGIWEGHQSLDSKMIWVYWKKKKAKRSPDRKFDNEREFYLKPERCPD